MFVEVSDPYWKLNACQLDSDGQCTTTQAEELEARAIIFEDIFKDYPALEADFRQSIFSMPSSTQLRASRLACVEARSLSLTLGPHTKVSSP